MKNLFKIKLNILEEKLYLEGITNQLYNDIATYGEKTTDVKLMIESSKNKKEFEDMIGEIGDDLKLTPGIIFTFGSGVAALHGPVSRLLEGSGFNLSEKEIVLLIITAIATLVNSPDAKKLISVIKEKGLVSALRGVKDLISNTEELINNITRNSTGVTYSIMDIMGFTSLLVPTMNVIDKFISDNGITTDDVNKLFKGLLLSTLAYSVKAVLKRINKKFS